MLRVKNWQKHFEKAQTRACEYIRWVPMPNKHDTDGFVQVIEHEHGAAHYGVWCLLVQVASRCTPRGTLAKSDGSPHTADSLGRITRLAPRVIKEAIGRFLDPAIGWLEEVADSALSADCESVVVKNTERNGTERENRTEQNRTNSVRPFMADEFLENWPEAFRRADAAVKRIWPEGRMMPLERRDGKDRERAAKFREGCARDNALLRKAAFLSLSVFDEDWLFGSLADAGKDGVRNRMAYLKKVLAEKAEKNGHRLNDLLDAITVPERLLPERRPRQEAAP